MAKIFSLFFVASLIGGCAATKPYFGIPEDYSGPTASIKDTSERGSNGAATFYYVEQVDGHDVINALSESRRASQGTGFRLNIANVSRPVRAQKITIKIAASETESAPIHSIFRAISGGRATPTAADFEFSPQAGRTYSVIGENRNGKLLVWLVDDANGERFSPIFGQIK